MRKWVTGDNAEEGRLVRAAPTPDLQVLWESTHSRWDAINDFMDEFNEGPEPHEAAVLGRFVEIAFEGGSGLERRDR